jgi:hypothetical protein
MPITTFLHDGELNIPTRSELLNDLLKEVRTKTGEDWQVIERKVEVHIPAILFWKPRKYAYLYEVYVYVGGVGPWQVINAYRDREHSINTSNSLELVVNYFYGMLAGIHAMEMKSNEARRNPQDRS